MQPNSTNGVQVSARDMLESLRLAFEKLEAELREQKQQNEELKRERDDFRSIVYEHLKKQFGNPKAWDDFDPKDYTLTIDDLLAVVDEAQ